MVAEGVGRLGAPPPDGRALSSASVADADGVGRADLEGVADGVGVALPDGAGAAEGSGGPRVGLGAAVGPGGFAVGAAVGVEGGAVAVGGGVGTGVGVGVGTVPTTTMVGPMSVGSLPCISATNVTCQVPAGSVD